LYKKINLKLWLLIFGFWTVVAVIVSTQLYLNGAKVSPTTASWIKNFYTQLPIWYLWAIATPLIFGVVKAFPLLSNTWYKSVLLYFGIGAAISFLFTNLALVYIFSIWKYLDLSRATLIDYTPYFFSRFISDNVIYFYTLSVSIAIQAYANRKSKELEMALLSLKNNQLQNQLTQSQLQALKLQLSPHFLFNTLHTISSLTLSGKNEDSVNVTTRLGDFLRRSLEYEDHQLVTLKQELDFFDLYLEIESERFKDKLNVSKNIDENLLSTEIPNLILQPLIENAIKHGISQQRDAREVELCITAENGNLLIKLFNQGKSLPEDFSIDNGNGIGLQNIKKRLEKLYPNPKFKLENMESKKGVLATISFPIKKG
jgi:two-component system, LytTR family, sensor kinase